MAGASSVDKANNQGIGGLLNGVRWDTTSLTYSLPANGAFYGANHGSGEPNANFEALNATQRAAVNTDLNMYVSAMAAPEEPSRPPTGQPAVLVRSLTALGDRPGQAYRDGMPGPPALEHTEPTALSPSPGAERRHLTVLFCDLVGSTALAEQLDPEDLGGVMRGYWDRCAAAIARCGGHVARYVGDGGLALFGYPHAREDAAERSVRAGLAIIEAVGD